MKNKTRDNLIATIRKNIPEEINLTIFLSNLLNISRESAYRRIRGEINFSFEEIAILSQDLGFSLDNIVGTKRDGNALFNIHMLQDIDYLDIYVTKILEYGRLFREKSEQMDTKVRISINKMPYFFHIYYKSLSRFQIYKWLYQNQKITPNDRFSSFVLPEKVLNAHQTFFQDIQKVRNVTVIMDNNVFWSVAKDIDYFYKRGLLSEEELIVLKAELHAIVNWVEQVATDGVCPNGGKIDMYVSAVDLEASYLHFEYGLGQFSQVRIYSISAIDSFNERLCRIQKEWIESQKRYSVLISESGEMQRFEYLNKQREYIDNITQLKRELV